MAKSKLPSIVNSLIAKTIGHLGFIRRGSYREISGVLHDIYFRPHANGEVVVCFGCAFSNSKNLFVSAWVGLNVPSFVEFLEDLKSGLSAALSGEHALVSWGISDTGAEGFDPSPGRPGMEFVISNPLDDRELAFIEKKLPEWIEAVERHLYERPLFEFYKFEDYIGPFDRWREVSALFKLLAGERYVGNQLLLDLRAEAAGKRPRFGEERWPEIYGAKRSESEYLFQSELYSVVHEADGSGIYTAFSKFKAARARFEWNNVPKSN